MACDLYTIMRGILSPNDMKEAMERATTKKVSYHAIENLSPHQAEDFKFLQRKSDFLGSMMGKGVILLSLSMIKYSWYVVMRTNFEGKRSRGQVSPGPGPPAQYRAEEPPEEPGAP